MIQASPSRVLTRRLSVAAIAVGTGISSWAATAAYAQPVFDHMKCYALRDSQRAKQYTADLVPKDSANFSVEPSDALVGGVLQKGCRIRVPAKFFCTDVDKQNAREVLPPHDPAEWTVDGPESGDRLCYKLTCPRVADKEIGVIDQFGTRDILVRGKTQWLCTPVTRKPLNTDPCGIGGNGGQCGGFCPNAGEVCLATSPQDCGCVPESMRCNLAQQCGQGLCTGVWETCVNFPGVGCGCSHP